MLRIISKIFGPHYQNHNGDPTVCWGSTDWPETHPTEKKHYEHMSFYQADTAMVAAGWWAGPVMVLFISDCKSQGWRQSTRKQIRGSRKLTNPRKEGKGLDSALEAI